uniref:Uncharacterized protein n=1 Tax=Anguilla anguilla TaxID=7936 RepID=A0A0E9TPE1_ANGAN
MGCKATVKVKKSHQNKSAYSHFLSPVLLSFYSSCVALHVLSCAIVLTMACRSSLKAQLVFNSESLKALDSLS